VASQISAIILPNLSAVSSRMKHTMIQIGFDENKLSPFTESFLTLEDFHNLYTRTMEKPENLGSVILKNDETKEIAGCKSTVLDKCLVVMFDSLAPLELDNNTDSVEAETTVNVDNIWASDFSSFPQVVDNFLEVFLSTDLNP
jgi:hypothetical protein